ncbi:MAG TPA: HlyD family secretion protein [Gammaproteobacteria bacterium]|nr:HlyD family secretion protein [Gammaproteobacteria bacterium]
MKTFFRSGRLRAGALLAALALLAGGAGWYWSYSSNFVSTDDAYINAHIVRLAAQVSGRVIEVQVTDNQTVAAGAPLLQIDPEPFRLAVTKAEAELRLRQAELQSARLNQRRVAAMVRERALPAQEGDDAAAAALVAEAAVAAAEAVLAQVRLDLEHTRLTAPAAGTVANLSLRPGSMVEAGAPLFSIIASDQYWVDANFRETELADIRVGDRADIRVDNYPDRVFHGEVESVSGGSGTAFSLLPPQNATGNWVKVIQRVPVKVMILDADPALPLRVGTSAAVRLRLSVHGAAPADSS